MTSATAGEAARIHRLLERGLAERRGEPVVVDVIERRPFELATSYELQLLRVVLSDGERVHVVVKDFGRSRLPKDDLPARAAREVGVYRDILDGTQTGTAALLGIAHDPVRLMLEHVDGTDLRHHDLATWMKAFAWLGAFQAEIAEHAEKVRRCEFLIRHDTEFFLSRAKTARAAISAFGPPAERRLSALLDNYERLVAVMVEQPRTLVHGSFRPQNIIVSVQRNGTVRICPVDWELAGLGSPLYDLAFLADGFSDIQLAHAFEAFLQGWERDIAGAPKTSAYVVDCIRLHKVIKSIGDSVALGFPSATVEKLLNLGERYRERLA